MKELTVQWAGPIQWAMPTPVDASGAPAELRATKRPIDAVADDVTSEATGHLVHDLPGDLYDVTIIINHGMYDVQPRVSPNRPIMDAAVFRRPDAWQAGEKLNLADETRRNGRADVSVRTWIDKATVEPISFSDTGLLPEGARQVSEQLILASLISQAGPPPYNPSGGQVYSAATRRVMHGMDLGVWMTRPCIIVMGHMGVGSTEKGAPCPTPMTIEGRDPNLRGRTFVRWVYPLDAAPPAILATPAVGEGEDGDEEGPGF